MNNSLADIVVVIVSYNCRGALRQCLCRLTEASVIVVDNGSADGSADLVRSEFPAVRLIVNATNRGFAAACNQGIRQSTVPFVLLLNPDTQASAAAVQRLLEVMQADPQIGACGPLILNADGTRQSSCRRFPTLGRMALAELGVRSFYYVRSAGGEVDQLMGSCLLVRRAALEQVGLLDERFFVYFEEVDLCLRLKRAGWPVVFVHEAVITHAGGQSSRADRAASLRYRYRSLFAFYRKHYPGWQLPVLQCAVQTAALLRLLIGQREYCSLARELWKL